MKPYIDKRLAKQLLSVGFLSGLFIFVMILILSVASDHNNQKSVASDYSSPKSVASNHDTQKVPISVDAKPVIAETPRSQPAEEKFPAVKPEHNLSSIKGNQAERLYHPIIIQAASHHQIDPALVKAIIMAESSYNPRAISKKGAKGLMQLMPATAQALGVEDSFNPKQNISGGVRYFKKLVNRFDGDVKLALAAYNAGSKNVMRYQGIPPFKATRYYIKKVFKYYQLYKNQMKGELDRA
jgi:soluble lytic murein transglycosylase-like protein